MYAFGLDRCGPVLNITASSSVRQLCPVSVLSRRETSNFTAVRVAEDWGSERDVICYGSGRPDRRGRRDLPYIRRSSREKQKEHERRAAGVVEEEEEELLDSDELVVSQELRSSGERLGKLPIESNGPPPLILHSYISDEKPLDGRSLRPLPLPSPHKLRPLKLPRPSLRRKLGSVGLEKERNQVVVDLVKHLAADIRSLPEDVPVSEVLDKLVWKLKRGALSSTVKDLGRMQLTERVLQVFLWLQRHPHLWPDDITLCAVIHVMVKAGEVEIAVQLQRGVGRNSPRAGQTLASALARGGFLEEAIQVVNYMIDSGWQVDGCVHRAITHWACRTGSRDFALRFWNSVSLSDLKLRPQDYTSVMASCSKLGLVDIIDRLYQDFLGSGLQPNIVFYTTLLSVLSRQGRYREAVALFWEMEAAGIQPDLLAYDVMLDVCAKLEDLPRALKVYKDAKNAGYTPTPDFYNTLIQLLVKNGSLSRAKDMTREMSSRGYTPSAQTLSCLSSAVA